MERLAALRPEHLDDEQRRLYATITGGPRGSGPQLFELTDPASGALRGPFNAFLLSPALGQSLQALGASLRFGTTTPGISARTREICILIVAHHWRSDFELYAHEAVARSVGVTEGEIEELRRTGSLTRRVTKTEEGDEDEDEEYEEERAAIEFVDALVTRGDVDDAEYVRALQRCGGGGARTLFELATLVGHYSMLALQMRVFRVNK